VQILGQKIIDGARKQHSAWRASLNNWTTIVKEADWTCNSDIQQTFNTADPVGRCVIFNIAGNKARLAAIVNFPEKRVTVKEIVSHERYDRKEYR
jgi:mRNA interferase HigB